MNHLDEDYVGFTDPLVGTQQDCLDALSFWDFQGSERVRTFHWIRLET